jgi:hypothetical protein
MKKTDGKPPSLSVLIGELPAIWIARVKTRQPRRTA